MLKIAAEHDKDTTLVKLKDISCQNPASLLDISAGTRQRALVDESGMITSEMGRTIDRPNKMATVHATL
jgi:hypothetical protein